jgi:hypothetical protein
MYFWLIEDLGYTQPVEFPFTGDAAKIWLIEVYRFTH